VPDAYYLMSDTWCLMPKYSYHPTLTVVKPFPTPVILPISGRLPPILLPEINGKNENNNQNPTFAMRFGAQGNIG
jgi:hypothetical protein